VSGECDNVRSLSTSSRRQVRTLGANKKIRTVGFLVYGLVVPTETDRAAVETRPRGAEE
jgi:hypothetical protein